MPGRIELDLVDPVAVAVVGPQHGQIGVGAATVGDGLGRAGDDAEVAHAVNAPVATLADERFLERDVELVEVLVLERNRLVEDLVGRGGAAVVERGHQISSVRSMMVSASACGSVPKAR